MPKRIMISFAVEDKWARDYLVGQSKNPQVPFEFVDMSVKEPWDVNWKKNCRIRIKGCDGMIALISTNTSSADGQLWEIKCAKEEGIPVLGVYPKVDSKPRSLPSDLVGVRVVEWKWENIAAWISRL
jgi:hypothetical protein